MIASPHGDGYCPVCRFIVGLDPDLLLENHTREDSNHVSGRALCKGSGRRPPKRIPYSSTKSRFKVKAARVPCPVCGRQAPVLTTHNGTYVGRHGMLGICEGYGKRI